MDLLKSYLTGLIRYLLMGVAGWLVANGIATPEQNEQAIGGIVLGIVMLGTLLWVKYKDRILLLTAASAPAGTSIAEAKDLAKTPEAPPVTTPDTASPKPLPVDPHSRP